jgi:hypothetical protein
LSSVGTVGNKCSLLYFFTDKPLRFLVQTLDMAPDDNLKSPPWENERTCHRLSYSIQYCY